jgi:hypothetical protein
MENAPMIVVTFSFMIISVGEHAHREQLNSTKENARNIQSAKCKVYSKPMEVAIPNAQQVLTEMRVTA